MSKNFARLGLAASTAALTGAVCSMTAFASGTSSTSTSGGGFGTVGYLIFMVLLFAVMYFILIRPQKKKDKEAKAMQDSLQVGDEIVTIGGIVGLVYRSMRITSSLRQPATATSCASRTGQYRKI